MSAEELDDSVNARQAMFAFLYGDALVEEIESDNIRRTAETARLSYKEERDMIQNNLKESRRKIRFWSAPATTYNLRRRLNFGCKILHFTGHGYANSLVFEREGHCGRAEHLKVNDLRGLFAAGGIVPDLVFLGSCRSEMCGQEIAKAGVPHVVVIKAIYDVQDVVAQNFCTAFYHALITGEFTVKDAFDIAFNVVKTNAPTSATTFLLLPEDKNHSVKMFTTQPMGDFEDNTPPVSPSFHLPPGRTTYIGGVELQRVVAMLDDSNAACVTITGEPGIGKTERALQACRYMRERNRFCAIFFAHCRNEETDSCRFPISGGRNTHMQHFCRLIGLALRMSPAASSPKELWDFLLKLATEEIKERPIKILLVIDAADALCESGGKQARASLATFLDEMCCTDARLKLLVTCEEGILESTDQFLSNSKERVHQMAPLKKWESAKLLLNLYPRDGKNFPIAELGVKQTTEYEDVVEALAKHNLVKVVDGHPGAMLVQRPLNYPEVEQKAIKYLEQYRQKTKTAFVENRAHEMTLEADIPNKRCRDIWVSATWRAADEGCSVGDEDETRYRLVYWRYLSLALCLSFCEVQTTSSDVGLSMSGENHSLGEASSQSFSGLHRFQSSSDWGMRGQSLGYGFDSSFEARGLNKNELSYIRTVLRRASSGDKNLRGDRHREVIDWQGRVGTGYARARCAYSVDDDKEDDVFSLETFARFSRRWLGPVITTLSRMRKDWAMVEPVRVHGFMSRADAKRQLEVVGVPGVFLLRFSESRPGRLVLTFTREAAQAKLGSEDRTDFVRSPPYIQESLVTVTENGQWTLHYNENVKNGVTYKSLLELVRDKPSLRKLYPGIEKETAFSTSPTEKFKASLTAVEEEIRHVAIKTLAARKRFETQ